MTEATSCGGVVICRAKILLLYKNIRGRYVGWVLPKGTVEEGESFEETALREVREEASVRARIVGYIGRSRYRFTTPRDEVRKSVYWYLMIAQNQYSHPQREEFFTESRYCDFYEARYRLKFPNERHILERGYEEYRRLRRNGQWK